MYQANWSLSFFFSVQVVRKDRVLEQIIFPVPSICEYLTEQKKDEVYYTCERDEHNSKVILFFTSFNITIVPIISLHYNIMAETSISNTVDP